MLYWVLPKESNTAKIHTHAHTRNMTRFKDLIINSIPAKKVADMTKNNNNKNGLLTNLQVIKSKLSQNTLIELRLGFEENEFRSKRDVESLITVIKEKFHARLSLYKHSCLKSICIGWRLPTFALGPILQTVIPLLLIEPVQITHIQLILNDSPWIPEECLRRIVSWHTLECLDLRCIRLRVRSSHLKCVSSSTSRTTSSSFSSSSPLPIPATRHNKLLYQLIQHQQQQQDRDGINSSRNNSNTDSTAKEGGDDDIEWKQANIVNIVPYVSSSVKTLKLMNCGITRHHVVRLCESIRGRMHGLKELSLRQNFSLDGGYPELLALPCIKSLDLSLCDLDETDGYWLGRGILKRDNKNLNKLSLAGNYRISTAIPEVVSSAASGLTEMDCSYCGLNAGSQREVFDILAEIPNCTIKSFRMQGIMLSDDGEALANCVRRNTSLRHLVVDHPNEVCSISLEGVDQIRTAIKSNYYLETLTFDVIPNGEYVVKIVEEIEFWFELNRCGRRALLQTNEVSIKSWSTILSRGAMRDDCNINILFWLLKHGAMINFT